MRFVRILKRYALFFVVGLFTAFQLLFLSSNGIATIVPVQKDHDFYALQGHDHKADKNKEESDLFPIVDESDESNSDVDPAFQKEGETGGIKVGFGENTKLMLSEDEDEDILSYQQQSATYGFLPGAPQQGKGAGIKAEGENVTDLAWNNSSSDENAQLSEGKVGYFDTSEDPGSQEPKRKKGNIALIEDNFKKSSGIPGDTSNEINPIIDASHDERFANHEQRLNKDEFSPRNYVQLPKDGSHLYDPLPKEPGKITPPGKVPPRNYVQLPKDGSHLYDPLPKEPGKITPPGKVPPRNYVQLPKAGSHLYDPLPKEPGKITPPGKVPPRNYVQLPKDGSHLYKPLPKEPGKITPPGKVPPRNYVQLPKAGSNLYKPLPKSPDLVAPPGDIPPVNYVMNVQGNSQLYSPTPAPRGDVPPKNYVTVQALNDNAKVKQVFKRLDTKNLGEAQEDPLHVGLTLIYLLEKKGGKYALTPLQARHLIRIIKRAQKYKYTEQETRQAILQTVDDSQIRYIKTMLATNKNKGKKKKTLGTMAKDCLDTFKNSGMNNEMRDK